MNLVNLFIYAFDDLDKYCSFIYIDVQFLLHISVFIIHNYKNVFATKTCNMINTQK